MHDWKKIVREKGTPGERPLPEDVLLELASHLEDHYEELRLRGASEAEAVERVLDSVEWQDLSSSIDGGQHAWHSINQRSQQLWLPGLVTLLAANLLLMAFAHASESWIRGVGPAGAYLLWLATQPLIGAIGAHLSRRAGGLLGTRLLASLFPSVVIVGLGVFLLLPASLLFESNAWAAAHPISFVLRGLAWVAPAAVGLLGGALPFLKDCGFEGNDLSLRTTRQ